MPSCNILTSLVVALAAAQAPAQVTASYVPFGAGCPGTGTGLGGGEVVPQSMAAAFGGSDNSIPFTWSPVKYQQVFLGSELPRTFTMSGHSVRQDERAGGSHGITVELEIHVGTTTRVPATMSTTFASNFDDGAPVNVLPRTFVDFPDQSPTPPADPSQFLFTIPWPVGFGWAPAPGRNLLLQATIFGNSFGSKPWAYALDAGGGQTARLYGSPATATSGALNVGYGLVLAFRETIHTAVPKLIGTETPQINDRFPLRIVEGRASSVALLFLGLSRTSWVGIPLPFSLGAAGAPGCSILASGEVIDIVALDAAGSGRFAYDIPNDIYILGSRFYNQFLIVDPPANQLGLVTTNAGAGVIGNQ